MSIIKIGKAKDTSFLMRFLYINSLKKILNEKSYAEKKISRRYKGTRKRAVNLLTCASPIAIPVSNKSSNLPPDKNFHR